MNNLVKVEIIDKRIARLVLNWPEAMNAINVLMGKKLTEELEHMAYNDNIKVVVITSIEK